MAHGPAAALSLVDDLVADKRLAGSHLLASVRGELLTRLGRTGEARSELTRALDLAGTPVSAPCSSESSRDHLTRGVTPSLDTGHEMTGFAS